MPCAGLICSARSSLVLMGLPTTRSSMFISGALRAFHARRTRSTPYACPTMFEHGTRYHVKMPVFSDHSSYNGIGTIDENWYRHCPDHRRGIRPWPGGGPRLSPD